MRKSEQRIERTTEFGDRQYSLDAGKTWTRIKKSRSEAQIDSHRRTARKGSK